MQEYDKIYHPVMFASRTLKSNELNYGIPEKDVLALLRILELNYNAPVGRPTFYFGVALHIHSLVGTVRSVGCSTVAMNSEITKCVKGEDENPGSIGDEKEPRRKIQAPIPAVRLDEDLYAVSFDGSARVKRGGGAYSAILWKLPEWRVLKARSGYAAGLTVNEAECHGLLLCLDLLEDLGPRRLGIYGGSNLVIRQVRAPGSTLLRQRAFDRLHTWPDHELLHVQRHWNASADNLASAALQRQCGIEVKSEKEIQDLVILNRLDEILIVKTEDEIAQIPAVTTRSNARSGACVGSDPDSLREEVVRELRIERIRQAQDEESWISGLKK
ncbi:reverse transcriptase [Phytophthora megakarya]|uniref:Reverse transcriptase n=1 Tax=Phytophthora megakarya TaxID=4795 RepID=A0A225V8B3_9STRA|nr:reverse transcriptase [Phytophthora megakarya]